MLKVPLSRSIVHAVGVALALGFAPPTVDAQIDRESLRERLETWYKTATRKAPGEWGIAIADQTGSILWGVDPDEPLVPASTVKVLTTGFARTVLGGDARLYTRVVGTGSVDPKSGAWIGTWALELNGDPSLERGEGSGPTLYDLALQLASAGVRKLSGPLRVQSADGPATATYPAVWSQRHYGRLFAPLVGPITLHENVVWFTIRPGSRSGRKAVLGEVSPNGIESLITVKATTRAGRRARLRVAPRGDGGWVVTGTIGTRAGARRLAAVARKPEAVLEAAWAAALRRAGIEWHRGPYVGPEAEGAPRVLAEVASPPLDSLASEINRRSLNVGAELLLRWAGGPEQAPARLTEHVRQVTGTDGVHLVDGSGLSYDDRVAPATFVSYLARFPQTAAGRNFSQLLPPNGTGTLRRLSTGLAAEGVVRAKTGTLGHVSSVVGYLGRADGVLLVSLIYNGSRPAAARQAQWELFRTLGADGVVIAADTAETPAAQLGGDETARPSWWPHGATADSTDDAAADGTDAADDATELADEPADESGE